MRFRLTINIIGLCGMVFNLLLACAKPKVETWVIPFLGTCVTALAVGLILSMIDYADYLRRKEEPPTYWDTK